MGSRAPDRSRCAGPRGVGHAQPDAPEAAGAQRAQELAPERLALGLADVEPEHLAPAGLMHAVRKHQRLLAHAARLPDALDLGVQPQIRVGALQFALAKHAHLLVEAAAEPADLVLAHAAQPELLDQAIDLARGDAVDVGLLRVSDGWA